MKPFNILFTIIIAVALLGLVVWVGQYHATLNFSKDKPNATIDDVMPLPKSDGPPGKVEIDEVEYEFGARQAGDSDEHTFTIKNVGSGPLQVKLGKPSCQCTVGQITKGGDEKSGGDVVKSDEPVDLAPSESVNILVKWNMKAEIAKFRQFVPVFTTDPERRQIDLTITGSVDDPIKIAPVGYWDLGEISRIEPTKASGFVFSTVLDKFELVEVPQQKNLAKVVIEPADQDTLDAKEAKSGYKINIEVGPKVPIGLFFETIKLKAVINKPTGDIPAADQADSAKSDTDTVADGKTEIVKDITVTGRRAGPIEIRGAFGAGLNTTSNRLVFSDFPAAEGRKATFNVFVKGMDEELVIKSLEPSDTRFKARILGPGKVFGNSKSYQVEIEIPPGPAGKHRQLDAETVDLILNHPEAPDLKLLLDYNALR